MKNWNFLLCWGKHGVSFSRLGDGQDFGRCFHWRCREEKELGTSDEGTRGRGRVPCC